MLFVLKPKKNCKPEQKDDNSYNLPMGQSKFSDELAFWFISIENGGKPNSNNTLRVEINQFCDSRENFLCHRQNVRG